jgi:hypothetical protein
MPRKTKKQKYDDLMVALQEKYEKRIQTKVRLWLEFMSKEIIKGINTQMIRKDQAEQIVIDLTDWEATEKSGIITIKPAILTAIAASGQESYKMVGIEGAFDMLHPAAVELAQTITADLVREVTEETKAAIRVAIRDGVNAGKSMPQVGKRIKPLVGLTEKQVKAVANFEERILSEVKADGTLRFNRDQVDRKVARYENRLHRKREKAIAGTETNRAVSEASLLAYEEAEVNVEWLTRGELACEICAPNEGKIYTIAEARGQIPAHPN